MSDASSGGVFSRVALTKSIIFSIEGAIASWTCSDVTILFSGNPVVSSLPLISIDFCVTSGIAQPSSSFTCSAVVPPTARFRLFFI